MTISSSMRQSGDGAAPRQEPRDALPAGTVLGDAYRVERTLGQGGFGIVYLATDLALQRPMAIKEYLPVQLAGRGEGAQLGLREASHRDTFLRGLQSFLREARLLAQFDHPSLVRVYRFWEENHTAYMAMPYCEGPTLKAARDGMLRPPDEAWLRDRLLLPLLGALDTLHAGSCLHRDVSPGNILLKSDGQPVLLDFGSARRVVGDMTQPLTAILNPSYAAIEQYAESPNLPQGPWTDIYGLAAVVYYVLSGRAPVPATVRAVNEAALMPMAELAGVVGRSFPGLQYSAPFLAALDKALAVRPADRWQSAQAMREALASSHVQPDVTIEGPPLQAVRDPGPPEIRIFGDDAPAAADEQEMSEEEEQAIRAAIATGIGDVGDWPPMARAGRPRIEPVLVPHIAPRNDRAPDTRFAALGAFDNREEPTSAAPGKVALKVVPGRDAAAERQPADAAPARPAPQPSAPEPVPAPPVAATWAPTSPAITAMRFPSGPMAGAAAAPAPAASAPEASPASTAPAPAESEPVATTRVQPTTAAPAPMPVATPPAPTAAVSSASTPAAGAEALAPAAPVPPAVAASGPASQRPVPSATSVPIASAAGTPSSAEAARPVPRDIAAAPAVADVVLHPAAVSQADAHEDTVPASDFPQWRADSDSASDTPPPPRARRPAWGWAAAAGLAALLAAGAWQWREQAPEGARVSMLGKAPTTAPVPAQPTVPAPRTTPLEPTSAGPTATPQTTTATPAPTPATPPTAQATASPPLSPAPAATPPAPTAADDTPAATTRPAPSAPPAVVAQADDDTPEGPAAAPAQTARTGTSGTTSTRASTSTNRTPRKSATPSARAGATAAAPVPKAAARTSAATTSRPATSGDPRAACGSRTNFSLYYCMRTQCRQPRFAGHAQCKKLLESDEVN
ncbi:protein kinase domain-containing protein [Ideonella sp. BN130291]|uniref:protein kinase domain-containing protein n=1 Tax=Ideonella sp. BN130291 TaxID=3112940 RepID=UPI002E2533CE|nr:protein kinase [Ideonella sp. BN130291]